MQEKSDLRFKQKADAEKSQARLAGRQAGDSVEPNQKFLAQPDSQPGGAAIEICFKISRLGFSSRSPAGTLLNFKM